MNYGIFRSKPIMTLNDLAQIGSHNKREKKTYKSNTDIKLELTKDNIELVPLTEKYVKGFHNLTKEYKKQHEEKQKTERDDRKRSYTEMLNKSKSVVADELLFTATNNFFKDKDKNFILEWAKTCMDFVYNDLGYTKEQILHATLHLDEETPHIHCVVVPLVKKMDKRTNTERYTISKKQYIKDKIHLSQLQDIYNDRLREKGYDLERGIKGSNAKHQKVREFKKTTKYYENKVETINKKLDDAMNDFDEKMKTTKNIPFDKKHVIVEKDTFDSMNNVIKETKKVAEFQPKMEQLFNEVDNFTKSHQSLEKENQKYKKEVSKLETENKKLKNENRNLIYRLNELFQLLKKFLRKLLQRGNDYTKDETSEVIKNCYDNNGFDMEDVITISRGTTKQDELFDYANAPDYYKERVKTYDKDEYDKKYFELSR